MQFYQSLCFTLLHHPSHARPEFLPHITARLTNLKCQSQLNDLCLPEKFQIHLLLYKHFLLPYRPFYSLHTQPVSTQQSSSLLTLTLSTISSQRSVLILGMGQVLLLWAPMVPGLPQSQPLAYSMLRVSSLLPSPGYEHLLVSNSANKRGSQHTETDK